MFDLPHPDDCRLGFTLVMGQWLLYFWKRHWHSGHTFYFPNTKSAVMRLWMLPGQELMTRHSDTLHGIQTRYTGFRHVTRSSSPTSSSLISNLLLLSNLLLSNLILLSYPSSSSPPPLLSFLLSILLLSSSSSSSSLPLLLLMVNIQYLLFRCYSFIQC